MKKELGISALLLVLAVTLAIMEPNFLRPDNIHAMLNRISMYGIFSIGCGIVIITGGIDLSIGSVFALLGVVLVALLRQYNWPWMLARSEFSEEAVMRLAVGGAATIEGSQQ